MSSWVKSVREWIAKEFGAMPGICIMATTDDKGRPTARCMTVREINAEGRLLFVSDRRTRKDDHLRSRPDTELCFWLANQRVQIRLSGQAGVIDAQTDNFIRQTWWDQLPAENRAIFGADPSDNDPPMPGTFELIVVYPTTVEIQDLTADAHQKQVWKAKGASWEPAHVM